MSEASLYERLGGYDAISAVANALLQRLQADALLSRFWEHRGLDGVEREKQLLIDYLCHNSGGPMYYTGRDMVTAHEGMRISDEDWQRLVTHLKETLASFSVPEKEAEEVVGFINSTYQDIVEV